MIPAFVIPEHTSPFSDREEAIYLLWMAAEIEHGLMLQYLYAAFSLGGPQDSQVHAMQALHWRNQLIGIAREEMAHLATVQNILLVIGGPISFERPNFPISSTVYPFKFMLEPLTRSSLVKYLLAESPTEITVESPYYGLLCRLRSEAPGQVRPIVALYDRIVDLLGKIDATDFSADSLPYQANAAEWELRTPYFILQQAGNQQEAINAIRLIAEQGEAPLLNAQSPSTGTSHFVQFAIIYSDWPKDESWNPARPVAVNPRTTLSGTAAQDEDTTPLTHVPAKLWAQLANLRYRMLLNDLGHLFTSPAVLATGGAATSRGLLISWAFGEMYHLRALADILAWFPADDAEPTTVYAGIPFEMPYTLAMPDREPDRWRRHRDLLAASNTLITRILNDPACCAGAVGTLAAAFANRIMALDQAAMTLVMRIIQG